MKITFDDIELAKRLEVDLRPGESPAAILQLTKLIDGLLKRIAILEAKRR